MLLLNINRRPYMDDPMGPSDLTLGDIERPESSQSDNEVLCLIKEAD